LKIIVALLKLTRFKEFTFFVTVTTLLGIASAHGEFGWQFLGVLFANWLAVMFAFMINDVEDADDDALNPRKIKRNPVSAGDLRPRTATMASFLVAGASALIYSLLGFWPFVLGIFSLILGWFYSWRKIRLKNMAFVDLLSHCMMLAGLQFLPGYLAFENRPQSFDWLFPFTFVVAISLYGELFNELRDLDGDLKAGLRHTGAMLGARPTYWLMMAVLSVGVYCGFVTIFLLDLIPTWVVILLVAAALVLTLGPAIVVRRQRDALAIQESFQKPLEIAAAFALGLQFAGPWAWAMLGPAVWSWISPYANMILGLRFF
jgi:4-hydroxybenzoate polyprenyltransferase